MSKKILFLVPILVVLLSVSNVHAKTTFKIGNSNVNTFNYISVPSGWTYFDWQDDVVYSSDTFPDYFMITICTDAAPIVSWVNNRYNTQGGTDQLSLENVTIFNTSAQCKFPDSTYSGAHIVYIIGKQLPERGTSTINWLINSGVTFYNNATASYSLLDIVFSQDPISYDLNTNTLITQNQDIINQNQTIINQNSVTNDKLDDMLNADAEPSVKPDDEKYNDYESAEGDLLDKVNQADLTDLSIGIDANTSKWLWETLTDLLQSHSAIFGMVIAILSIGIIKLALGR